MPPLSSLSPRLPFFGLLPRQFDEAVAAWGWPAFRGRQVREWVYTRLVGEAGRMSNLSKLDRQRLAGGVQFAAGEVTRQQHSSDGTIKLLLTWPDGSSAESVMIPDGERRTACVSSQVGCPVGCKFCASGLNGAKGNLSAAQIVEQVFALNGAMQGGDPAQAALPQRQKQQGPRITNVVFMGMGEPLANYANVLSAVRILHDPECFGLGARRLTISTVGVPAKMRQLAQEDLPINLAISLHAPNEALRKQLIPWAEHFALDEILDAAREYFQRSGREVTLEYILLSGVNDRPEHARDLARICRNLRANVNLIRYNEVEGLPFRRPRSADVMAFQEILRDHGVNAHVRKSRGRDIDAACGQLRRRQQQEQGGNGAMVPLTVNASSQGGP